MRDETRKIAELMSAAHEQGYAWGDMAIICRRYSVMEECAAALRRRGLPHQVRKGSGSRTQDGFTGRIPGSFHPGQDTIKILTMHASKGLEFPVVALPGVGHMPEDGELEAEEARLFYVAATPRDRSALHHAER